MARTQEEPGLRKPSHRASKVRAIDGEDLKLLAVDIADPARNIRRHAIRGAGFRILKGSQPRLSRRVLGDWSERQPRLIPRLPLAEHWRKKVPDDGNSENYAGRAVQQDPELQKHSAPRHRTPPRIPALEKVWPGSAGLCAASHATTSDTSCGDIGRPGRLPRQSGAPNSGRPAITIVRSP